MRGTHSPTAPRRTATERRPPRTVAGLLAGVVLAVVVPLALFALAYPATAGVAALACGGLAAVVRDRE